MSKCINFIMNAIKYMYRETNNTVISPVSLEFAMLSLIPGTNTYSYEEIRESLFDERPVNYQAINEIVYSARSLVNALKATDSGAEVKIHNFFYLSSKYQLLDSYFEFISYYLDTKFKLVNFDDDTLELYNIIDAQVSEATLGRIRQVIKNVPTVSDMLVVSSNTFQGELKHSSGQKYGGKFNSDLGEYEVQYVIFNGPMLISSKTVADSVVCFEMPYLNENLGLLIILPREGGARDVVNALNAAEVRSIFGSFSKKNMEIHLPLLPVLKQNIDLAYVIQLIGIQKVFEEGEADLSRLVSNPKGLHLESIITNNEVLLHRETYDEEKQKSKSNMSRKSKGKSRSSPTAVVLNRPFIFFITCNTKTHSKVLTFGGVVNSIENF